MPTVIDSLVVTLGLDPSNFTKGQREALDAFKKTQDQAVESGKEIEGQSKKSMDALGGIKTQALEMFAVFTGGKSVVEFTQSLVKGDAAVGRLSRSINVSAQEISKWQGVARIYGGTAEGMAGSFTSISDAVAGFKVGAISPLIADFRALGSAGGKIIDINKGVDQTLLDMADNFKAIHDKDPAQAGFMGRRMGIDAGLLDLLMKGSAEVQKMLDRVNALGPATKASADAAGDLEKRWNAIFVRTEGTGRQAGLIPDIMKVADFLNLTPAQIYDYLTNPNSKVRKPGTPIYSDAAPGGAGGAPTGAFTSQADKEAFIRAEAAKRGINPDVAMAVARSEGFNSFKSAIPGEESYSAFQLHLTPGGRGNAVGDQFAKTTGLDVRDPANEARAIQYALDDIKAHGWGAYHGAANGAHIGAWAGIDRGAGGGSTTTTKIDVNGPVNIYPPPGTDGAAMAGKFTQTLKNQSYAAQANDGQN
jgi:hypothetical protein